MNTILEIAKLQSLSRRPGVAAFALPRHSRAFALPISEAARRWTAIAAILVALAAVIAYVAAVNVILFAGEAMKQDQKALGVLQQEHAALSSVLVARESPAWLETHARANGMVEAVGIRFLDQNNAVALSR